MLRLQHGLTKKFCHIKKKINSNKLPALTNESIYIVAIYAGELNLLNLDRTRDHPILEAVFSSGRQKISFNPETNESIDVFRGPILSNQKQSGARVENGLFLDDANAHIAAVVFFSRHWKEINQEVLGDSDMGRDFHLVHNPYANTPLQHGLFPCGTEYVAELKQEEIVLSQIYHEPREPDMTIYFEF